MTKKNQGLYSYGGINYTPSRLAQLKRVLLSTPTSKLISAISDYSKAMDDLKLNQALQKVNQAGGAIPTKKLVDTFVTEIIGNESAPVFEGFLKRNVPALSSKTKLSPNDFSAENLSNAFLNIKPSKLLDSSETVNNAFEQQTLDTLVNQAGEKIKSLQKTEEKIVDTVASLGQNLTNKVESMCERALNQKALEGAIATATATHFEQFKEKAKPEQLKVIAAKVCTGMRVAPASDIFDAQFLRYPDPDNQGKTIDFSNLHCKLYGESVKTDYIFTPAHLHNALIGMLEGSNIWLGGERGTGKTMFISALAKALGRPFQRINFDEGADRDFIGGTSIKDGSCVYAEGVFLKAIRTAGSVILLDEPSFARPNALAMLHAVLEEETIDSKGIVIPETGEKIEVAKDCFFAGADNTMGHGDETGNYAQTNEMNSAFMDRFAYKIEFNYLDMARESELISNRTGCSLEIATNIVQFAHISRQKCSEGLLTQPPSLRNLVAFANGCKRGLPISIAFKNAILTAFPRDTWAELQAIFDVAVDKKLFMRKV